ncbi:beta-hydroxyacyl-ACP dehydratase [Desulfobulbus sp. US4]|nr:beta-hydroxyacyl-ACP dehydratase [Desulfobulbus sp. US4]
MRFHLVDRVDEICYDNYIKGCKCVSLADDVFNEHFPGYPIFPGCLIQEGLAQLAGSFFEIMMHKKDWPVKHSVLTIVNKMKFRKAAEPGDKMIYRADIAVMREDYGVAHVKADLDGSPVANGTLTFSFIALDNEIVFESRKLIYEICMKNAKVIQHEDSI